MCTSNLIALDYEIPVANVRLVTNTCSLSHLHMFSSLYPQAWPTVYRTSTINFHLFMEARQSLFFVVFFEVFFFLQSCLHVNFKRVNIVHKYPSAIVAKRVPWKLRKLFLSGNRFIAYSPS